MREALKVLESGVIAVLNSVKISPEADQVKLRTKGEHLLRNITRLGIQGRCLFWDSADGVESEIHEQVRAQIAQGKLSELMETSAIAWEKIYAVFGHHQFDPNNHNLPNPRASFSLALWQGDQLCNGYEDGVEWYNQDSQVVVPRLGSALASDNNILVVKAPSRFIVGTNGKLLTANERVRVLSSSNKPKEAGIDIVAEAQKFAELTADPENILTTNSSIAIWLFPKDGQEPIKVTVTTFLPVGRVDWQGVRLKLDSGLSPQEAIQIRNVPGGLAFTDVLRWYATSMVGNPKHRKAYEDTVFCFRTLWPPALSAALGDEAAEEVLRQTHRVAIYRHRREFRVYLQDVELSTYWS